MERVTPTKLSLLFLMQLLISPRKEEDKRIIGFEARNALSLFIFDQISELDGVFFEEPTYDELKQRVKDIQIDGEFESAAKDRSIMLGQLEDTVSSILSPDDLMEWTVTSQAMLSEPSFHSLEDQTMPSHFEGSSIFGIFVRSLLLNLQGMGFEGLILLCDQVEEYYRAGTVASAVVSTDTEGSSCQINKCQKMFKGGRSFDQESFEELDARMHRLAQTHPEVPQIHFMRYLNCVKHREFQGALDSLHRYFDHGIKQSANTGGEEGGGGGGAGKKGGKGARGGRRRRALALGPASLHLALCHLGTGGARHAGPARAALGEALQAALRPGARDDAALAHTLLAAARAAAAAAAGRRGEGGGEGEGEGGAGGGGGGAAELLALAASAAQRAGRPALEARARLSGAALAAARGGGGRGAAARVLAEVLGAQRPRRRRGAEGKGRRPPRPLGAEPVRALAGLNPLQLHQRRMQQKLQKKKPDEEEEQNEKIDPEDVTQISIDQLNVEQELWELWGYPFMSSLASETLLNYYSSSAGPEEAIRASIKVAFSMFHGSRSVDEGKKGPLYPRAINFLKDVQAKYPFSGLAELPHAILCLEHEWALMRGDVGGARGLLGRLRSVGCAGAGGPAAEAGALEAAAARRSAAQAAAEGGPGAGAAALEAAAARADNKVLKAIFQLDAAEYLVDATANDPTVAIPAVLECLALCEELAMVTNHALASILLAKIHFRMGYLDLANSLIKRVLPAALGGASAAAQGRAWAALAALALARARAGEEEGGDEEEGNVLLMEEALSCLEKALECFTVIDDNRNKKKALCMKACILDVLEREEMRDLAASQAISL